MSAFARGAIAALYEFQQREDTRTTDVFFWEILRMAFLATLLLALDLSGIRSISSATPEEVQIALAKAAAPSLSDDADIYVLRRDGYSLAFKGRNGFACLVERERLDTLEPECYDAEGVATVLPVRIFVEHERARGVKDSEIEAAVNSGYQTGRFKAPRPPGIVYMMSDFNFVFDPDRGRVIHFPGHLMFYAPYLTAKDVGSGPDAPYVVNPGRPDALMIVVPARSHGD